VEMTGDFSLTLPVMLAVAIATASSRMLSYGTIYTTKLLRRGTDIDRMTPWRALQDLKVSDAMRPFRPPLDLPPRATAAAADGSDGTPDWVALAGPVTSQRDPQAVFATESLAQTLWQLEVYGRDGLPVLSADGQHVDGWVTGNSALRAIARKITTARTDAAQAQLAADWDHSDEASPRRPPAPLPGYQVIELTVSAVSPAVGARLGAIRWPPGTIPVSVLRDHTHRGPDPAVTLRPDDRISLLVPAAAEPAEPSASPT
jgi:CIC family chloride channel protein